jgi:hypothetical protein
VQIPLFFPVLPRKAGNALSSGTPVNSYSPTAARTRIELHPATVYELSSKEVNALAIRLRDNETLFSLTQNICWKQAAAASAPTRTDMIVGQIFS